MRVLFDAFWWERGPGANRTVQREIIHAWSRLYPADELVLALRRGADADGAHALGDVVHTTLWPHAAANRWDLPRLARKLESDVCVVHNFAPRGVKSIVFIHDAMFVDNPEWFTLSERLYFSRMLPWARDAGHVATSTLTEARRIDRLMSRSSASHPTGLGVPTALATSTPRLPAQVSEDAKFALTVGRLNVRKNLLAGMRGASVARSITRDTPLLVVGGTAHSGRGTEFPDDVQRAIDDGRIVLLGSLDDAEVAWLYSRASLVLSLSLDEGFGLPAVEAAAFGAPLLVSDIEVFRETVGGYASFIKPTASAQQLADAIDGAWDVRPSPDQRAEVVDRYSWDAAAQSLRALATTAN